jgi:hypothetical protein
VQESGAGLQLRNSSCGHVTSKRRGSAVGGSGPSRL